MSIKRKFTSVAVACVLGTAVAGMNASVYASGAGAFIGGVFATKLIENVHRQTEAEETQAAYASQPRPVASAPAPAQKSPQQRINELDKLAAGGYITPEEYKAKKKAILDSM